MITTLVGETYAVNKDLEERRSKFIDMHGDLAVERLEVADSDLGPILNTVSALPFLADSKLVIIKEMSLNSHLVESLKKIVESVAEGVEIIIVEPKLLKSSKFYKGLAKQTTLINHDSKKGTELTNLLIQTAKDNDSELSPQLANYLVQRLGGNEQNLVTEVEKLAVHTKITQSLIDEITDAKIEEKAFDMLDVAMNGKLDLAYNMYDNLRAQKEDPHKIMGLLVWQLQMILLAATGLSEGLSAEQVASQTNTKSYPINKAMPLARKVGLGGAQLIISKAADIDLSLKRHQAKPDDAVKLLIAYLATYAAA